MLKNSYSHIYWIIDLLFTYFYIIDLHSTIGTLRNKDKMVDPIFSFALFLGWKLYFFVKANQFDKSFVGFFSGNQKNKGVFSYKSIYICTFWSQLEKNEKKKKKWVILTKKRVILTKNWLILAIFRYSNSSNIWSKVF